MRLAGAFPSGREQGSRDEEMEMSGRRRDRSRVGGAAKALWTSLLAAALATGVAAAAEWRASGRLAVEGRDFTGSPADPEQVDGVQASFLAQGELRFRSADRRHQILVAPLLRLDQADSERSHADLRQGYWRYAGGAWDLLAGADRVFWGVTESRHLVDVINQVDAVEDVDDEDRLGQPMVSATFLPDWGTVSVYALAGFRERSFPGAEGRPRLPIVVDTDDPVYEAGAGSSRVDYAVRYAHVMGGWDVGFHAFSGTSREPRLVPDPSGSRLVPHYDLMNQAGIDLQYTRGAWLWKAESIVRETRLDDFAAFVGGMEYTLYQLGGTAADLGLLAEYLYDGRDKLAAPPTFMDDDVFLGARLAFNDVQDSSILAGVVVDRDLGSTAVSVEAERRLRDSWTVELEVRLFSRVDDEDLLRFFRSDDFITLRISWNI